MKPWELKPEEKARIQRETAKIAKRYREQEESKSQQPLQEVNYDTNTQTAEQTQDLSQQQHMKDIGNIEL